MSPEVETVRPFNVRARREHAHHPHVFMEVSFEAAAMAYTEEHPHAVDGGELSVIVTEVDSGHEHCFRIDLDSGETEPCA